MVVCGNTPPKDPAPQHTPNVLAQGEREEKGGGVRRQQHQRLQLPRAEREGHWVASEDSRQTHTHVRTSTRILFLPPPPAPQCLSLPRLVRCKAYFRDLRSSTIILYSLTYMRFASSRLIPFSFDQASHFAFPA